VFGMQWQVKRDEPVSVELWASLPKPSQPRIEPKPRPEPKAKPAPEPETEPAIVKKPDIAIKQDKPKPKPDPKPEEKPEPIKPEPKKPEPKPEPKKPEPKTEAKPEKPAKPVDRAAELAKLADEFSSSVKPTTAVKTGPSAADVAHAKAKGEYGDAVRSRVERNVIPPADSRVNNKAVFEVTLLPSMEVLRVVKRSSSGNAAYDDAVERAILKTSPFPPLPEGLSFREVRIMVLEFRP
jgi:colicin import membrane protein